MLFPHLRARPALVRSSQSPPSFVSSHHSGSASRAGPLLVMGRRGNVAALQDLPPKAQLTFSPNLVIVLAVMEADSISQHCSPEDSPSGPPLNPPSTDPIVFSECVDREEDQRRSCPSVGLDAIVIPNQNVNSTDCVSLGDSGTSLANTSVKEISPAKKSLPKAKLVIPESLLYSGVDGSPYNLDSLPVPHAAKVSSTDENIPVDVQKHFGTPKSSERSEIPDTDASAVAPQTPFLNTFGASGNPAESPALEAQDGTPGQSGWTQDGVFVPLYSRKEKSLGLLCDKYASLMALFCNIL